MHEPVRHLPARFWLGMLLAASLILHLALALKGGQGYFGDEARYYRGPLLYRAILTGDGHTAGKILALPDHAGFTLVALAVAPIQQALATLGGAGDWNRTGNITATLRYAAAALGIFATLNVWLVHRLARTTGANDLEAGFAALLAASAVSLGYFSRHLLPYDASLSAALGSLLFGLRGAERRHLFAAGALAALAYLIYNGAWFCVPVLGAATLASKSDATSRTMVVCWWLLGALSATTAVATPGVLLAGGEYWHHTAEFARTVKQGVFAEGWTLPFSYLWTTEGWAGAAIALTGVAVIGRDIRLHRLPRRVFVWLALAAGIYLLLALASTGLGWFVVYGRTARTLTPLLCLTTAYALARPLQNRPHWIPLAAGAVILAAVIGRLHAWQLIFPGDTKTAIWRDIGSPKQAVSFSGTYYPDPVEKVTRPDLALVNAQSLYPLRAYVGYPAGQSILRLPHPANFAPYRFEGFTPRERRLLREHPPEIRLVRLTDSPSVPDNPPPASLVGPLETADGYDHGRR